MILSEEFESAPSWNPIRLESNSALPKNICERKPEFTMGRTQSILAFEATSYDKVKGISDCKVGDTIIKMV